MEADKDRDGKISFEEFTKMVENTDVSMSMTLGELHDIMFLSKWSTTDILAGRSILDDEDTHQEIEHALRYTITEFSCFR